MSDDCLRLGPGDPEQVVMSDIVALPNGGGSALRCNEFSASIGTTSTGARHLMLIMGRATSDGCRVLQLFESLSPFVARRLAAELLDFANGRDADAGAQAAEALARARGNGASGRANRLRRRR